MPLYSCYYVIKYKSAKMTNGWISSYTRTYHCKITLPLVRGLKLRDNNHRHSPLGDVTAAIHDECDDFITCVSKSLSNAALVTHERECDRVTQGKRVSVRLIGYVSYWTIISLFEVQNHLRNDPSFTKHSSL